MLKEKDFTPAEKFVWKQVRQGKRANFNESEGFGGELNYPDPEEAKGHDEAWPENRILRAEFLEALLFDPEFRDQVKGFGIWIVGGWIEDDLIWSHRKISFLICFHRCRFEGKVTAIDVRFYSTLFFDGSWLKRKLNLNGVKVEDHLFMRGATLSSVELVGAQIGGQLNMDSSIFRGEINLNGLKVRQGLLMSGVATFYEVDLDSANIFPQLNFIGASFNRKLSLSATKIKNDAHMSKAAFNDIDLTGIQIGGQLDLTGAKFKGQLDASNLSVGINLMLRDITIQTNSSFKFSLAQIGGNLGLGSKSSQGNELPSIDLSGSTIKGELDLGAYSNIAWQGNATLNLRITSVGYISARLKDWPDNLKLDGFRYEHLGGLEYHENRDPGKWAVKDIKKWLGKQGTHSPDPYRQMARVLEKQGHSEKAEEVPYAGMEETRKQVKEDSKGENLKWNYWWLSAQKIAVGYGFRKRWALLWMFGFWALGVGILCGSGQAEALKMNLGMGYSLDMLMPIMRLNALHYTKEYALKNDFVQWYFYFHQIMGYVLVTFLIAGLSGVFKDKK